MLTPLRFALVCSVIALGARWLIAQDTGPEAQDTGATTGACCFFFWVGETYVEACANVSESLCDRYDDSTWHGPCYRCQTVGAQSVCTLVPTSCD